MSKCLVTNLKGSVGDNSLRVFNNVVLKATMDCNMYFQYTPNPSKIYAIEGTFTDGTAEYSVGSNRVCGVISKGMIFKMDSASLNTTVKPSGGIGANFCYSLLHDSAFNYTGVKFISNLDLKGFTIGYTPELTGLGNSRDVGVTNINVNEFTKDLKPKLETICIWDVAYGNIDDIGNVPTLTYISLFHCNKANASVNNICDKMIANGRTSGTLQIISGSKLYYNNAAVGYGKTANVTFSEEGYSVTIS